MKNKWRPGIRMKFLLIFMFGSILAGLTIIVLQSTLMKLGGLSTESAARLEKDYALLYFVLFFMLRRYMLMLFLAA